MKYYILLLGLCLLSCKDNTPLQTSVTVNVSKAGTLDSLLSKYNKDVIDTLVVTGQINEWDMITIQNMDSISYLDLEESTIKHIRPKAFMGNDRIRTVILPNDISVGYGAFSNCKNLKRLVSKQALFDITFDKWLEELGYSKEGKYYTDNDSIPNLSNDMIDTLLNKLNTYAHLSQPEDIKGCIRAYYRDRFDSIAGFYYTRFEERLNQYYLDMAYKETFISEDDIYKNVYLYHYTFEGNIPEKERPELDTKAQRMRNWNNMLKKNRKLFEEYLESCQELYAESFLSAEGNWPKFMTYDNYTPHIEFIKSCAGNRFTY